MHLQQVFWRKIQQESWQELKQRNEKLVRQLQSDLNHSLIVAISKGFIAVLKARRKTTKQRARLSSLFDTKPQ